MGPAPDRLADALARHAAEMPEALQPAATLAAKRVLFDAVAVAVGAFRHRAAQAARRYCRRAGRGPCTVWGSGETASMEAATLANGVLLRCYDYNDLYVGKRSAAHPSDIIPGLVAIAEAGQLPGRSLVSAIALGYEVVLELLDALPVSQEGWDYTNLTAIGAACAAGRLMGLEAGQIREALAIAVIPHLASDEIESGELNARGDLTMWKRFNGGDAIRQAVYACTLASCGAEGAVRPFAGKLGLLAKLKAKEEDVEALIRRLDARRPLARVAEATMKRWPVGSRAQSAIQAALAARAGVADTSEIEEVRVLADPAAYEHLVRSRKDAWKPISRETADHSLPYIVAAAILDGRLGVESFAPERVLQPARQAFLQKVKVDPVSPAKRADVAEGYSQAYRTRVEIALRDGRRVRGEAERAPGHPENPLTERDLADKIAESAAGLLDVELLAALLWRVDEAPSLQPLLDALAVQAHDLDAHTVD